MKLLTKIVPLALLIAGLAGCLKEKIEPVPALQGGEAAFTVSVPGMSTPSTRALDATKEKELTAIDVVIFSNTDNKIVEHHRVGASDIGGGTGGNDYQFRIKGIENTTNVTLAVIANASDEVAAAVGSGTPKTAFLSALKVSADAKWDTNAVGYRTIPMYGEITVTGNIYDAVTNTVNLTRMLAKVDVLNNVAPESPASPADGDFELTAVHVVNRNTAGLIAPKWNATTGAPEPPPATTPNIPAGFAPGMVTWANNNHLTYTLSTGHTSLEDEIYLFESSALSDNPATPNGLRLVFEGNYTSGGVTKRYYYPVDFTEPNGAYMPVLRNHRYLFTITEAAGRGYDGLSEAVAAFGVMSNLRTSLVVVDESGIRHMVWNGEHFLGVSEKSFTVAAAGEQDIELQISTNYTGGWKAAVENPAANSWLTLTTTSGQKTDKTLTFGAAALTGGEWAFRTGTILLTAGRLETRLTVSQGDYKIVAEPANQYLLNGTTQHSFKVKSNTQWAVRRVSDPDEILLDSDNQIADMIANQSGGPNTTTGDGFTFTLVNDPYGSLSGKTFTVMFRDPTGKADDITVTVTAVACGMNGIAVAQIIGGRSYLTHMYDGKCWMVQNSKAGTPAATYFGQGTSYITGTDPGPTNGEYYYLKQNAKTACPVGWHLPKKNEVEALINAVYGGISTNLNKAQAKWWAGSQGVANKTFTGSHEGYYSVWGSWDSQAFWWYDDTRSEYYHSDKNKIAIYTSGGGTNSNSWLSVRCVRD